MFVANYILFKNSARCALVFTRPHDFTQYLVKVWCKIFNVVNCEATVAKVS